MQERKDSTNNVEKPVYIFYVEKIVLRTAESSREAQGPDVWPLIFGIAGIVGMVIEIALQILQLPAC